MDYYQIYGPAWTEELRFDVVATLPNQTSKGQFRIMLQSLLAERFQLAVHRETKDLPLYLLTVTKNGPKFSKSKPDDPAANTDAANANPKDSPGPLRKEKDGYPNLPAGSSSMAIGSANGHSMARLRAQAEPLSWLVRMLSGQLAAPVADATGLTEQYDFTMSWIPQPPGSGPPDNEDLGPSIFSSLQDQLGLKLVSKKGRSMCS